MQHSGDQLSISGARSLLFDDGGQDHQLVGGHTGIGVFVPNPRLRATQQHADGILRLHTLVKIVGIREQIALQLIEPVGVLFAVRLGGNGGDKIVIAVIVLVDRRVKILRGTDALRLHDLGDIHHAGALGNRHLDNIPGLGGLHDVDHAAVAHVGGQSEHPRPVPAVRLGELGIQPKDQRLVDEALFLENIRDLLGGSTPGNLHIHQGGGLVEPHHIDAAGDGEIGQRAGNPQHQHRINNSPDTAPGGAVHPALFLLFPFFRLLRLVCAVGFLRLLLVGHNRRGLLPPIPVVLQRRKPHQGGGRRLGSGFLPLMDFLRQGRMFLLVAQIQLQLEAADLGLALLPQPGRQRPLVFLFDFLE